MVDYELVKNHPRYWEFIRRLRNMEGVRQGFVQQDEITEIEQAAYMLEYNNNFWVCLVDGCPMKFPSFEVAALGPPSALRCMIAKASLRLAL